MRMASTQKPAITPTSQACLACRGKHLRCDGVKPVCKRCLENRFDCTWVQSKRGYVGGRRKKLDPPTLTAESTMAAYSPPPAADTLPITLPIALSPAGSSHGSSSTEGTILRPIISEVTPADEYLIDVYYKYFHSAHPILLPRKVYVQDVNILPDSLKSIMKFIACNHTAMDTSAYEAQAQLILNANLPADVTKVQTMLLLTIVSFARCERETGTRALTQAIDSAYALGLQEESFGAGHAAILRESWRRTWWELYTLTGLISLVSGVNVRLTAPSGRLLPCSCDDYNDGRVTESRTLDEMQDRWFDQGFVWSSFAYRAEATRLLGMVRDLDPNELFFDSPSLDAAIAAVKNFILSLPSHRARGLRVDGTTDEVMSCAVMIINLASICLHVPRSDLADVHNTATICNNDRPPVLAIDREVHTALAMRSADAISELVIARRSFDTITPCFSCSLAFTVSSQIAAYSLEVDKKSPTATRLREYVQLALTALSSMGQSWQIAAVVRMQLAQFVKDLMRNQPTDSVGFGMPTIMQEAARQRMQGTLEDEAWLSDILSDTPAFNFNDPILPQPVSVPAYAV